jgi:hypothetical protein
VPLSIKPSSRRASVFAITCQVKADICRTSPTSADACSASSILPCCERESPQAEQISRSSRIPSHRPLAAASQSSAAISAYGASARNGRDGSTGKRLIHGFKIAANSLSAMVTIFARSLTTTKDSTGQKLVSSHARSFWHHNAVRTCAKAQLITQAARVAQERLRFQQVSEKTHVVVSPE